MDSGISNLTFILGMSIFVGSLTFVVRMIGIIIGKDPITKQIRTDPEYSRVMTEFKNSSRPKIILGNALLVSLLSALFLFFKVSDILSYSNHDGRTILILGPLIVVSAGIAAAVVVYNLHVKSTR